MYYIIKRNGKIVPFDKNKIINAVNKAFIEIDGKLYEEETAKDIADYIEDLIAAADHSIEEPEYSVEKIQDHVEELLWQSERLDVARAYTRFRHKRELIRKANNTDESILGIIEHTNDEVNEENSNKNPTIAPTQRDYMAGEVSKDVSQRLLLPKDIIKAHKDGIIHFHDMDYFAQHIHNCFSADTKFITSDGLKAFSDFSDGDIIKVLSIDGTWNKATVKKYGKQKLFKYTFYNGKLEHTHTIKATENHRWILKNNKETTNLKIGDKLIKPPVIYSQDIDFDNLTHECQLAWCKGFGLGDGTVESQGAGVKSNRTRIRLCGEKDLKFLNRFNIEGCSIRNTKFENNDREVIIYNYHKEIPTFNNLQEMQCFLNGLYCADGNFGSKKYINYRLQSSKKEVIDFIRKYANTCGLYITKEREETGKSTNFTKARPYTIAFSFNPNFHYSYTVLNKEEYKEEEVWCLEVENTHNFILEYGIPTGNCCLVNLEDMLQNGTVISEVMIEKPHDFSTACNIATQIIAQVASSQYGGQTISLAHLAPFVDISRRKIKKEVLQEFNDLYGRSPFNSEEFNTIDKIVDRRIKKEIKKGIQTIQYQIVTLQTTNGQTPFVTVYMYLGEAKNEREKQDLALIIEETLKQRMQGTKNEKGIWVTPAFPKLIYTLEEDNISENKPYWYLTELAAECTAKRMVPDYISEKMMLELKGDVYPCMGK